LFVHVDQVEDFEKGRHLVLSLSTFCLKWNKRLRSIKILCDRGWVWPLLGVGKAIQTQVNHSGLGLEWSDLNVFEGGPKSFVITGTDTLWVVARSFLPWYQYVDPHYV
jgi:hypothetical protein